MPNNFDKQEWLKRLNARIQTLRSQKELLVFKVNNENFFAFDLGQRINITDSGLIEFNFGPIGLKMREDLIGMAGFFYNPLLGRYKPFYHPIR